MYLHTTPFLELEDESFFSFGLSVTFPYGLTVFAIQIRLTLGFQSIATGLIFCWSKRCSHVLKKAL